MSIHIDEITKKFSRFPALNHVSFTVESWRTRCAAWPEWVRQDHIAARHRGTGISR